MKRLIPTTQLRRGDQVVVLAGDDRGKQGRVVRILTKRATALVDGVNLVTRHVKPSAKAPQGGRIEKMAPVQLSNLQLICPNCSKPTKGKTLVTATGRERQCRLCQASLVQKEQA